MARATSVPSALALILTTMFTLAACGEDEAPPTSPAETPPEALDASLDGGVDAGHDAGPPLPPARLMAKRLVSKIRERPDRDSFRMGYLRAGAVVNATTGHPVRTDDPRCRGGWYELTTGGFVCNGRDVVAFWGRRLPHGRGAQPDRVGPLPYAYGRNRQPNAPMYRRLPTDDEAVEFEGFHIPGQPALEEGAVGIEGEGAAEGTAQASPTEASPTVAAPPEPAPPEPAPSVPEPTTAPARTATAPAAVAAGEDGAEEGDVPTLASLMGDPSSALMRRMMSGFIVSLDRDFRAGQYSRRYWRTVANGFVPYRTIGAVTPPDFSGARIDEQHPLPVAFVTARDESYYVERDARVRRVGPAEFHTRVDILRVLEDAGTEYYATPSGRLYRERDVRTLRPAEPPDAIGPHDQWIEVNLERQYLIAYEGSRPVYATLISSGRAFHPDDPTVNFLTPTGLFRIRAKHLAAPMDGDTASDGPYSIDDVPYVMYFQLAYALHAAFWHRGFGFPRSHGCVNLAPRDAQWIFNWSEPHLPEGWHGAYPTPDHPGTWIWIHGETPGER